MRNIVIGTAGHIDHGKTSLVKALTGVSTDRLVEEQRRGITIELGFASWSLGDDLHANIIDVPGHEKLVRTMVAGAFGVDLAMLVVAADDGVMPQTREHADILSLLGVSAGICVITKADAADEELTALVVEEISELTHGTVFGQVEPIVTSSTTGLGLQQLKDTIAELVPRLPKRSAEGFFALPLDRTFTVDGHGHVVTGTSLRGELHSGDNVDVWSDEPHPVARLRVREIQSSKTGRDAAIAGERVALNLTGRDASALRRGMVVSSPDALASSSAILANVTVLSGAEKLGEETLMAHIGTCERQVQVLPLGGGERAAIDAGDSGVVLLRLDSPVASFAGQMLVLRRPGVHGQATVAGGELLDPQPPQGKGAVSWLATNKAEFTGTANLRLGAMLAWARGRGVTQNEIGRRLPPGIGERARTFMVKKQKAIAITGGKSGYVVDAEFVSKGVARVVDIVKRHHDADELSQGIGEAEVVSSLPPPERHLGPVYIDRAVGLGKLHRDGARVAAAGRGATIDEATKAAMNEVLQNLREAGLSPPFDKEFTERLNIEPGKVTKLLSLMRRAGSIRQLRAGCHIETDALAGLETTIIAALSDGAEITATEFKSLAGGLSRKWAIPLLEHLDRAEITIRVGDIRRLHPRHRSSSPK